MSSLFKGPKIPKPEPVIDSSRAESLAEMERLRRQRSAGMAATMVTGGKGVTTPAAVGYKKLFGE